MLRRSLFLIATMISGLGIGLTGAPALANTVTDQSIWSKDNALARARAQMPAGAVVSGSQCQTVEVGMNNERYICTITYDVPAAPGGNGSAGKSSTP